MGVTRATLLLCLAACGVDTGLAGEKATVVFSAPEKASQLAVNEMQREAASILQGEGVELFWMPQPALRLGTELTAPVQVRLRGRCDMRGFEPRQSSQGALAWTHVSDRAVLPFVDIDCDRVRSSLFSVMWGEDFQHRDFLLGRALGRVLAHELHHALHREMGHSSAGLSKARLQGDVLVRETVELYRDGDVLPGRENRSTPGGL